ncbi:unnamed protein product [Effrenium voratum]|nr:unnamed protein product [Effrenium voratum]
MNVCSSDVLSRGDIPSDWDPRSPVPVGGAPGAMGNGQYKTSGVEDPVLMQACGRRLQQFKDESIAGDMKWDPRYTARCDFGNSPCGPEGFSWVLQAAVYEGKLARVPDAAFKTTALGVGTLEMMQMLDQTPLGYQTKDSPRARNLQGPQVQPHFWSQGIRAGAGAATGLGMDTYGEPRGHVASRAKRPAVCVQVPQQVPRWRLGVHRDMPDLLSGGPPLGRGGPAPRLWPACDGHSLFALQAQRNLIAHVGIEQAE